MTRKHYKIIATVIRRYVANAAAQSIAYALASAFASDNPNFDRNRFLDACGVE